MKFCFGFNIAWAQWIHKDWCFFFNSGFLLSVASRRSEHLLRECLLSLLLAAASRAGLCVRYWILSMGVGIYIYIYVCLTWKTRHRHRCERGCCWSCAAFRTHVYFVFNCKHRFFLPSIFTDIICIKVGWDRGCSGAGATSRQKHIHWHVRIVWVHDDVSYNICSRRITGKTRVWVSVSVCVCVPHI